MKNCSTLGEALRFWVRHNYAYTHVTRARFETVEGKEQIAVKVEYVIKGLASRRQSVEHGLLLCALNIVQTTGGAARVRKIMLSHEPHLPPKAYRSYFGCDVSFGEKEEIGRAHV